MRQLLAWTALLLLCGQALGQAENDIEWIDYLPGLSIPENLEFGVLVGTLKARFAGGITGRLEYGFNNKPQGDNSVSEFDAYFRINATTGNMYTHGTKLDYENRNNRDFGINVIARNVDNPSQYSKRQSRVLVTNLNDEKPKFENNSLTTEVTENEVFPPGGLVLLKNIYVTDPDVLLDGGLRSLSVEIQNCIVAGRIEECKNDFDLRTNTTRSTASWTGDFLIKKSVDYERASKIQVQLLARDGNDANNKITDIVVNIKDAQDLPPRWILLPTNNKARDEMPPNGLQIQTEAEDQDTGRRPIYYTIPEGQQNFGVDVSKIFTIDPVTGLITNIVTFDLENTTFFRDYEAKEVRDEWKLQIRACEIISEGPPMVIGTTNQECIIGDILVTIEDINDNKPTFNTFNYVYTIYEDYRNGRILEEPEIIVTDRDTDTYNKYFTEFVQPIPEFGIFGSNRIPAIYINDTSLIDYDRGPQVYNLQLRTVDIQDNSLISISNVTIYVLDTNDNRPVFPQTSYEAFIREDAPDGQSIIRITATDIDSGSFGTAGIEYSLGGITGIERKLFEINPQTGLVIVAPCGPPGPGVHPCIDYDVLPRVYDLTVTARDDNSKGRSESVNLRINILDVNDNPPDVPDYVQSILEDETSFTPPLRVEGTDVDQNTILTYSILSQSPGTFWKIDSTTGEITVDKPNNAGIKFNDGDRGTDGRRSFFLDVLVSDGTNTATSKVTIRVIDINDNGPRFLVSLYNVSILETTPPGTSVVQITAQDADDATSPNGILQYSLIAGNIGGRFLINPENGMLTVAPDVKFDYDVRNRYQMLAVANDKGTPQLSANATIIVNIIDENNKDPSIDPYMQTFTVYENVGIGTYVGTVKATDPDINARLNFTFTDRKSAFSDVGYPVENDFFKDDFIIEPNGRIITNAKLDSRMANILIFGVQVEDVAAPVVQRGEGTVLIIVKPFNTMKPVFENFDQPLVIPEEQPIGSVILSLIARDDNGIRGYEVIQQRDSYFTISPNTGAVSIISRVDYDDARRTNDSYFVVEVADDGDPVLTETITVNVVFTNINDNFPEFMDPVTRIEKNLYLATIPENSPDGTSVTQVYAFDNDRPDNNTFNVVHYYMEDDRFDVDNTTGEVFVRLRNGAVLDRELNPRIQATVIARDNPKGPPSNQRQRSVRVQVTLTDVNDNRPVFSRNEYRITIFETIGVDTEILQLFSSDLDIGDNAISFYSKIPNLGTDYDDFFGVRLQRGQIYVKKSLVRHVGEYTFYVQAQDKLGTEFTANATVIVEVKPSANGPPEWVIPPIDNMTIYVLEEQYNGMLILDVSARDLDTGNNGIVDYSFIYEGRATQTTPEFKINKVTGVIQAEIVYDRETVDRYVLLLKATDRGETPLETTRFLTIEILDVNDNAPVFEANEAEFEIKEDASRGDFVGIVTATDRDKNDPIYYTIISGNEEGVFQINEMTGNLTLAKPVDRESNSVYYLDVQATNREPDYTVIRNRRRRALDPSIITVRVLVGDVNDLAPIFLSDRYYGCISTRSSYGKQIMTIQAVDRDAIGTGVVRYRILNGPVDADGNNLFDIHDKYGVITNKVLMRQYADRMFNLRVNARDGEDIATSESSNTSAMVFVTQPGKEVKLLITQNTAEVRLYQSQIQSIIEKSQNLDYVCITEVRDHVVDAVGSTSALWTDVFISGIGSINGGPRQILPATTLKNIIVEQRETSKSDYDLLYIKEVEEASSSQEIELEDQAVLIILIIIAVLIFLVIIFCIIAFMCIRAAKRQKKQMLVHKTNMTPPAPVIVPQEPEPVLYDNRVFVTEEQVVQAQPPEPVIEHDPVHVEYAVVRKGPSESEYRPPSPQVADENVIVVGLDDDNVPQEPVYTIETEVVDQ